MSIHNKCIYGKMEKSSLKYPEICVLSTGQLMCHSKALFFFILGLRIFFSQNIKVGGGKKIKIKITNNFFLFNLKHIWIREKKITKIV